MGGGGGCDFSPLRDLNPYRPKGLILNYFTTSVFGRPALKFAQKRPLLTAQNYYCVLKRPRKNILVDLTGSLSIFENPIPHPRESSPLVPVFKRELKGS